MAKKKNVEEEQNAVVKKKKKKNSDGGSSSDDDDSSSQCSEDYSSIFRSEAKERYAAGRFNREMFDDASDDDDVADRGASDAAAVRNHPCNEVLTDSGGERTADFSFEQTFRRSPNLQHT